MSISLTLDRASMDHLDRQFALLAQAGPRSCYSALHKIAKKITSESQMRIMGRQHVVTARLKNSIFTKTRQQPNFAYRDKLGNSFVSELQSVTLARMEVAIGTNVEYAAEIETLDSFLGWALNNVDITRSISEDAAVTMENVMRFGIGIIPQNQTP